MRISDWSSDVCSSDLSVIGREVIAQSRSKFGKMPDALVACVGGGSNAIGLFHPFIEDKSVAMYGVEAGGRGIDTPDHAAPLAAGTPGILHGNRTYIIADDNGKLPGPNSTKSEK